MIYIRGTSKRVELVSYWGKETTREIIPKPWWNPNFLIMAKVRDLDNPDAPLIEIEAQHLVADGGISEIKREFDRVPETVRYD
jgi:hypothetical protein